VSGAVLGAVLGAVELHRSRWKHRRLYLVAMRRSRFHGRQTKGINSPLLVLGSDEGSMIRKCAGGERRNALGKEAATLRGPYRSRY
jgi:hypothetical protein